MFLQPFAANSDLFDAEIDSEPEQGNGIIIEEGEQQEDRPLDGGNWKIILLTTRTIVRVISAMEKKRTLRKKIRR